MKKLIAKNIKKSYKGIPVLNNINFEIESGEVFGIIGPNGAGKSTLLKILLGLCKADDGEIIILPASNIGNNYFGAMIDRPSYYDYLTGRENMEYFQNDNNSEEINQILKIVGLNDLDSKRKVKEYSLGMKQRLGIALALLDDRPIIILDEPLNGLDAKGIYDVRKIIIDLAKKKQKIVIISSHILSEIEKVVDKIIIFNKINLLYSGDLSNLNSEFTIKIEKELSCELKNKIDYKVGKLNVAYDFNTIKYKNNDLEQLNNILKILVDNNQKICELKNNKQSLEEFYFNLLEEK